MRQPRKRPRAASSATWIAVVAGALALAWITLNTLRTEAPGSRGLPAGERLPPFAVPLALSPLEGDANVATRRAGAEGRRPACEVRGPDILNSCQLAERGPVVLAFLVTRSERCEQQVDVLDRVARRYPDVSFAAVAVRGDRARLRRDIRRRRWRLPVGWDRDGAVSSRYAVAICPTVTLAAAGGRVRETALSFLDAAALSRRVAGLRR